MDSPQTPSDRLARFCDEYADMGGLDPENVYTLHLGNDKEAGVRISDLRAMVDALAVGEARTTQLETERDKAVATLAALANAIERHGRCCPLCSADPSTDEYHFGACLVGLAHGVVVSIETTELLRERATNV